MAYVTFDTSIYNEVDTGKLNNVAIPQQLKDLNIHVQDNKITDIYKKDSYVKNSMQLIEDIESFAENLSEALIKGQLTITIESGYLNGESFQFVVRPGEVEKFFRLCKWVKLK